MASKYWTAEDLAAAGFVAPGESEVFSITDAPVRQSVSVGSRAFWYAFKMFLRVACIVAAVLVGPGVWQWVFLVGAAVIPWLAVMVANGESRQVSSGFSQYLPAEQQLAIGQAQQRRAERSGSGFVADSEAGVGAEEDAGVFVFEGEVLEGSSPSASERGA